MWGGGSLESGMQRQEQPGPTPREKIPWETQLKSLEMLLVVSAWFFGALAEFQGRVCSQPCSAEWAAVPRPSQAPGRML